MALDRERHHDGPRVSEEKRDYIRRARRLFDRDVEQKQADEIGDLADMLHLAEETVRNYWEEAL